MKELSPVPPVAQDLERRATVHTTPCGEGVIVWHAWGNEADEPVILLHGGSGSWTHWLRNIDALAMAGYYVLVPDLPGFGDSDSPGGSEDADAMPAPLEQGAAILLGDRAAHLVGFSFGGMVSGLWASASPQRAHSLTLVGAPALGAVTERQADLRGWRHLKAEEHDRIHRHNLGVLMLHDQNAIDDDALDIHRANVVRDRLQRRRLAFTSVLAEALATVHCPVHAIYGEYDAIYIGRTQALEDALRRASPHAAPLVWVAGAGHWVQYERADEFNNLLIRQLESTP